MKENDLKPCSYNIIVFYSLANKLDDRDFLKFEWIFNSLAIFLVAIELMYFRYQQRNLEN